MEGKVSKGYESSKRRAADLGSATVKEYEVGMKETLFGTFLYPFRSWFRKGCKKVPSRGSAQTENIAFESSLIQGFYETLIIHNT
jgi:hypothetical protein